MGKIKAAKKLFKKATEVFPFINTKPAVKVARAGKLANKKPSGMVGKKLKNTKPFTVRGINIGSKSRLGKGDIKVEDLSTIVDVKLPKEPSFLRRRKTLMRKK